MARSEAKKSGKSKAAETESEEALED